MKLEIDLYDEAKLRAAQAQLKADLETVEFALRRFASHGNVTPAARKPRQLHLVDSQEDLLAPTQSQKIRDAIEALPSRFTSVDIYGQFDGSKRTAVKSVLRQLSLKGRLKVLRKGAGKEPSIWEKMAP